MVITRRAGANIYYSVANPKIVKACSLIREVLFDQMVATGELAKKYGKFPK